MVRADAKKNYAHILTVAREVITQHGVEASLRDIARKANVGLGTLYRHFPTREALLDALLHARFEELSARASELETTASTEEALVSWLREVVTSLGEYQGVVTAIVTAMEDTESALYASCTRLRTEGARLLSRAQAEGLARSDMDGQDLFSLATALAWLGDQPASAPRSDYFFELLLSAILTNK